MSAAERRGLWLRGVTLLLALFCLWLTDIQSSTSARASSSLPNPWPPVVGKSYPEMELLDSEGHKVRISDFHGSVVLIEPVGMSCAACQAFSGGEEKGGFAGVLPQGGLPSVRELLKTYAANTSLDDEHLQFVQILLYDSKMGVPSVEDAAAWARHFGFQGKKNHHVLVGTKEIQGQIAYNLIPGFQLLDKNSVLRSDATGHNPKDNLYTTLLPLLPSLLKEASEVSPSS